MGSFGAERSNLKGVGKQRAQGKTIKLFAGVPVVNAFVNQAPRKWMMNMDQVEVFKWMVRRRSAKL